MTTKNWLLVDFDNTMMGTEKYAVPSLIARFNMLYGKVIDHELTFPEFKEHFHGQARETLCENLSKHFGITVDYPTLYDAREWRIMQHYQTLEGGIEMAPGLIEALTALKQQGVGLAFVSNNPIQRGFTGMRFANNGCGHELASLFGCAYFEAGEVQKPKPDVYLRAMEQLGTDAAHCHAVEDSKSGATSAVKAGIACFAFTGFADNAEKLGNELKEVGCFTAFNSWHDFGALYAQAMAKKAA